ncbi:MAG: acyloxyacyl hydrolase [Deltaproteobacteria bacterium]|nr:acyloxyacyl hydrolase [Deltaproteobacteria bacterium]MBW1987013.1 acyloxyacyl hydrolase [Deltaproteobacteria bacterium]MBW2134030.1 acyloxyacyl hydrolase [Deltaproteobacteria bacterium]
MFKCLKRLMVVICLVGMLFVPEFTVPRAGAADFNYAELTRECGLRFGWGRSFGTKEIIDIYTLLPRWGLFLTRADNPYLGKLRISLLIEGVISYADALHDGWEAGFTPLLKFTYPLGNKVLVYLEGGAGIIFENIDSEAFAHTFNFSPQAGVGVDFHLTGGYALTLAYRFRHSSNASLYSDNPSFDVNFVHIGLAYYY